MCSPLAAYLIVSVIVSSKLPSNDRAFNIIGRPLGFAAFSAAVNSRLRVKRDVGPPVRIVSSPAGPDICVHTTVWIVAEPGPLFTLFGIGDGHDVFVASDTSATATSVIVGFTGTVNVGPVAFELFGPPVRDTG